MSMISAPPATTGDRSMTGRGLKPAKTLAAQRPHGDRLRYMGGCRCAACRAANSAYERQRAAARRAGEWNGLVPADRARAHMLALAAKGVGRRAVGAAANVADTILFEIRAGTRKQIRAETERRVLAVTEAMASDRALVDARDTWQLIHQLVGAGFSKARIAHELGQSRAALQLGHKRVTVRNAHRVQRVHHRLMSSGEVLVPAAPTRKLIEALRQECYSEKQLARALGEAAHVLAWKADRIPQGLAQRVGEVYQALTT